MFPVIKGASYVLVNTPDMIIHNGTTQTLERETHPDSEYLKKLPEHIRSFEDSVAYPANQAYMEESLLKELAAMPRPWFEKKVENASRFAKYGEIMPQDEFYGLLKVSDAFDLVLIEKGLMASIKTSFEEHPLLKDFTPKLGEGYEMADIEKAVNTQHAEPLYMNGELVDV